MSLAPSRDWIALTLAIGICTALNLVTIGVMLAALNRGDYSLSENATQILTGWGGGIIGILGAVFGYRAGTSQQAAVQQAADDATAAATDDEPPPP